MYYGSDLFDAVNEARRRARKKAVGVKAHHPPGLRGGVGGGVGFATALTNEFPQALHNGPKPRSGARPPFPPHLPEIISLRHKATVRALGLRRLNHTVELADTPQLRGMLSKVARLVDIQEA